MINQSESDAVKDFSASHDAKDKDETNEILSMDSRPIRINPPKFFENPEQEVMASVAFTAICIFAALICHYAESTDRNQNKP